MTLISMTGFAREEVVHHQQNWVWELRSVNGKQLDIKFRLPAGFDDLEIKTRTELLNQCKRGTVIITLTPPTKNNFKSAVSINYEFLDRVIEFYKEIQQKIPVDPPRLDGLLSVRGVLEFKDSLDDNLDYQEDLQRTLLEGFKKALSSLIVMKKQEGEYLHKVILGFMVKIQDLVSQASNLAALQPPQRYEKLKQMLAPLLELSTISEERLAQEAAFLTLKCDVREELDRLSSHIKAVENLLQEEGNIGRKLDFLCQEFMRETNTMNAKSADMALTKITLELKGTIEQFREQVQNIE
ncbi:MAG: YicC family protein [Alphaproteobacteria bacterium]|nr:YicC family protein [Alphaproteobacteria bacterium]